MHEYISAENKPIRKSSRIAFFVAGIAFLVLGVIGPSIYSVLIGIFMVAANLLKKQTAVTDEGVVVTYDVIFYKYYEKWPWEDILEIHRQPSPDGSQCALHVMKDVMSRRLLYSSAQAKQVLALAQQKNPRIHIADVDR